MRRASITAALVGLFLMCFPTTGGAFLTVGILFPSEGRFNSDCGYSNRLPDDPIVKPAQPGASHSHDFFGNKTTNAFSTYDSLQAGGTTCRRTSDTAAYWVPTVYENGTALRASSLIAYYTARGKSALSIKPFPAGLRIVAGNASATQPQPMMVASWSCGENMATDSATIPLCALGGLQVHIRFPDCWDGRNLDFTDHRSHMAYSTNGVCPTGYANPMPALQINATYPSRGGPTVTLASGSSYSAHGDFFNSWNQQALASLVRDCLQLNRNCG